MSIIKLKNVSKFYYSKGVIAQGFTKINLSFDNSEFVAITGESGSGKSTLLNVISGLDTYEEGEMYINGKETSHYTEKDFEDYRRKYVSNIFQNFNLINSYTVYQNIELVLLLNGHKKSKIKSKVINLIKRVGLYEFKNTKVSKLSGGQKQKVAIARALAKETPIIIADEPTGNLDSKSAKEVIKLLSEISKEKLVIIVTHNYEQVEEYVTRKIKMHDGKILEDKKIKEIKSNNIEEINYKNITFLNKTLLALRNAFNIVPKFILLMLVFLFIISALISEYATFKEREYIEAKSGYNYIFRNKSNKRIVLKKNDRTSFTDEDYEKINAINNIDYIVKNDILLDTNVELTDDENFWIDGNCNNIKNFKENLDLGEMPKNSNEVIIYGSRDNYLLSDMANELIGKELFMQNYYNGEVEKNNKVIVSGIKYNEEDNDYNTIIYMSDEELNKLSLQINRFYSNEKVLFMDKYREFKIVPNDNVQDGFVYIPSNLNYDCPNENCINKIININVKNIFYEENVELSIQKTFNKNNINNILGVSEFTDETIFISNNDYNNLYNKAYYQTSIFVKDIDEIDNTINSLKEQGFNTLAIKDTLVNIEGSTIIRIIRTIVTTILVIALMFISYFVIRVILKSRNKYFSTIRMLGASKKISKDLLIMELFIVSNLAYFSFIIFVYFSKIDIKFIQKVKTYLTSRDYIILYIILILMSYIISQKFSKKLFQKSAIKTLNEEV